MAARALLIDLGKDSLSAGFFDSRSEGPQGFVSVRLDSIDRLSTAIGDLLSALDRKPGDGLDVYLSIHPSFLQMRVIDVPFSERKKIKEILPFELMGALSVDISEVILDCVPLYGPGKRALAMALEKDLMRRLLDPFVAAGLEPRWIGPALVMAPQILDGGEEVTAIMGRDFISISSSGGLEFFNAFDNRQGLAMSLAYIRAEGIEVDRVLCVGCGPDDARAAFPDAGSVSELTLPAGLTGEAVALYALWVSISRGTVRDAVNFRQGEFSFTRKRELLKRRLALTAALVATMVLIWGGHLYARYITLERRTEAYNAALSRSYASLFPGADVPADPLYALEARLHELEREASVVEGGVRPLEIMRALAGAVRQDGVSIWDFRVTDKRVSLKGDVASFEMADRLKESLSKAAPFRTVTLSDVKSGPSGGAVFSLVIETY